MKDTVVLVKAFLESIILSYKISKVLGSRNLSKAIRIFFNRVRSKAFEALGLSILGVTLSLIGNVPVAQIALKYAILALMYIIANYASFCTVLILHYLMRTTYTPTGGVRPH